MAKTMQASLIQKHFEKIVLALAGVIFIIVVLQWVLHSPQSQEVSGLGALGPAQIDAALLKLAQDTATQIERVDNLPPAETIPSWKNQLTERLGKPFNATEGLTPLSAAGVALAAGSVDIAKKMPHPLPPSPVLSEPVFTAGQELVRLPDPTGAMGGNAFVARDLYVARVSAVMDYDGFIQAWRKKLEEVAVPFEEVIFFQVTAEREELLSDGQWGSPTTITTNYRQPSSSLSLAAWPAMPAFTGDLTQTLAEVEAFKAPGVQEEVIEPSFAQVYWREVANWGTWRHRLPVTQVNQLPTAVVQQEHAAPGQSTSPDMPSGPTPYMPPPDEEAPVPPMRPPAQGSLPARAPIGPVLAAEAPVGPMRPPPGEGSMRPPPGEGPVGPMRPPGGARPAPQATPARPVRPAVPVNLPPVTPLPSLTDQVEAKIVQIWVHDASLEPEKTYRYRLKLELFNPVFGQTTAVEDPADAQQLVLISVSPWSAPVRTEPSTYYYVTGGGIGSISIEVYRNLLGSTFRQAISLKPGEPVGRTEVKEYINPVSAMVESTPVDFSTGCILVDFDLNRTREIGGATRNIRQAVVQTPDGRLVLLEEQAGGTDPLRSRLLKESQETQRLINERRPPR